MAVDGEAGGTTVREAGWTDGSSGEADGVAGGARQSGSRNTSLLSWRQRRGGAPGQEGR